MKTYYLSFGSVSPANYTGLFPTMTIFSALGVTAVTAPGITETPAASGIYRFQYGPTISTVFVVDGGATLAASVRYIVGSVDPIQAVDEQLALYGSTMLAIGSTVSAMGTTLFAIGQTLLPAAISVDGLGATLNYVYQGFTSLGSTLGPVLDVLGSTMSSFGSTSVDPGTLFGYVKRLQELLEGSQDFNKQTGIWNIYSRGSSVLLREKTLTNDSTEATRS